MKNIIIFGTESGAKILEECLNDEINIIVYVDNNKDKWGKFHNKRKIINPQNLKKYNYDYIIIASQYSEEISEQLLNLGIDEMKIFKFNDFKESYFNYIEKCIRNIELESNNIETIATGISYCKCGFLEETYKKKAINIASPSQDLYYDYNLLKFLIENNNFNNLKEVIIGLSYYSFQYDMSLSSMKSKVALYYKYIKLAHNLNNAEEYIDKLTKNELIGKKLINLNKLEIINLELDNGEYGYEINEKIGEKKAELDCRKNYPKTVEENKKIFEQYLKFLQNKNIKTVIVVFPVHGYYQKYFYKEIQDEFHRIINNVHKKNDFLFIDYFRTNHFDDNDFRDVSHLNNKGARKFTNLLNKLID